jgi:hypothetical protein
VRQQCLDRGTREASCLALALGRQPVAAYQGGDGGILDPEGLGNLGEGELLLAGR